MIFHGVKINPEIRDELKLKMPESINSKKERYISKYKISAQVADVLSSDKFYSDLFEEAHTESNAKEVAKYYYHRTDGFRRHQRKT